MTTTDDIFWLYERNKSIYSDCIKQKKQCINLIEDVCYCSYNDVVQPIIIGDKYVEYRYKVKSYIKIGDECPICMDPIIYKINAYITGCGHSFHRNCLFKVFETKWKNKAYSSLKCPICRASQGFPDMLSRYNTNDNNNELDILENFWITKDYQMGTFCNTKHYLGMKKDCLKCIKYRNTGEF
jgi:hypothetical protein